MISLKPFFAIALLALLTSCKRPEEVPTVPEPAPSSPSTSPTPPESSSPGQSPAVTASSAAAAAPECKDIEKTKPNTCQPAANGLQKTPSN
jgi:hypothetical protein